MPESQTAERAALDLAIEQAGGVVGLSRKLKDCSYQAIQNWRRAGRTPSERVLEVERVTGVSRHKLRPSLYPRARAA